MPPKFYQNYGGLMANDSNFDRNRVKGCNFGSEGAVLNLRGALIFLLGGAFSCSVTHL